MELAKGSWSVYCEYTVSLKESFSQCVGWGAGFHQCRLLEQIHRSLGADRQALLSQPLEGGKLKLKTPADWVVGCSEPSLWLPPGVLYSLPLHRENWCLPGRLLEGGWSGICSPDSVISPQPRLLVLPYRSLNFDVRIFRSTEVLISRLHLACIKHIAHLFSGSAYSFALFIYKFLQWISHFVKSSSCNWWFTFCAFGVCQLSFDDHLRLCCLVGTGLVRVDLVVTVFHVPVSWAVLTLYCLTFLFVIS